jgi:cell division protein FtsZ
MIPIHRNASTVLSGDVRIKIIGLGGAGSNALDRIKLDGLAGAELVAMNTDLQALTGSVAEEKVQLGRATTRGLGAGGDPEIGYAAAEEGVEDLRAAIEGAKIVILCVGLGGGTGSGAARIVAAVARELKAFVVAVATLPFSFEGRRRMAQAEEALGSLQRNADLVICFENDRMGESVSPLAGIQEAFSTADQTICHCVRGLVGMSQQRGLVHIGFDELATMIKAVGDHAPRCLFGYGEAEGDNRAHEALARALKSPLMDKGRMLEGARNVLIGVSGGVSMTLNEVQILMEEFNRHISDQTRLHFGASVDPRLGQKISVTILSALDGVINGAAAPHPARIAARVESSPVSVPSTPIAALPRPAEPPPEPVLRAPEIEAAPHEPTPESRPEPKHEPRQEPKHEPKISFVDSDEAVSPPPDPALARTTPMPMPVAAAAGAPGKGNGKSKIQAKQEQMQFEPVTRGRFEKSEPTIVDGQDLDVPTFLRRNVKVK